MLLKKKKKKKKGKFYDAIESKTYIQLFFSTKQTDK